MGRQPWVVQGLLLTRNAVSPSVPAWRGRCITLIGFTLLYGVLAVVDGCLMFQLREGRAAADAGADEQRCDRAGDLAMAY